MPATPATCRCLCRVEHPDTAVVARCTSPAAPGLAVVKSAIGVGAVEMSMCAFCFHQNRTQREEESTS